MTWTARARPVPMDAAIMVVATTALLVAFYYFARADTIGTYADTRGWTAITARTLRPDLHYLASFVLLGLVPVALARRAGLSWSELGLGLGNWRAGLVVLVAGTPLVIAGGWIASLSPAMRAVYPLDTSVSARWDSFAPHALHALLYYGAWEVLFRGVLLFGLSVRLGDALGNAMQTALSVTAHFGRAATETFAALPGGLAFGWIDLRIGSIWYVMVLHWLLGISADWFILAR